MIINLSPVFADDTLVAFVSGDKLTVNGQEFDFGPLPAGYVLPLDAVGSDHFAGPVTRHANGELELILRLPHPIDAGEDMRFPVPIVMLEDGVVPLPVYVPSETESLPPLEDNYSEHRLQFGSEGADSFGPGSTEQELRGDPVPTIDGLDGDQESGNVETDSSISTGEASESPGTSDRGNE